MPDRVRLYDYLPSGNGYKVRLILHELGVPYDRVELDPARGETRTPEYLAKNPNGKIPMVELPTGERLAESNAILYYFGEGTALVPSDKLARAQVLAWMFFEQYSHEPNIAVLRAWKHFGLFESRQREVPAKEKAGRAALAVMEGHLARHDFFAETLSVADFALYAYTHVAHEGGFDLAPYPAIQRWLARVADRPRHLPITRGGGVGEG